MEKIKNWFYKPAFTLICYAIALLIICYFGYTVNTFSYFFYAMTFVFFGKVISIIKPRAPKQEIVEEINDNVDDELIEA